MARAQIEARGISFEAANPRHGHEWAVWRDARDAEDQVFIPGCITSTNYVEHPELVAQQLERYAKIMGPERVIAGTDCGFGTLQGRQRRGGRRVQETGALVEGAERASRQLWGKALTASIRYGARELFGSPPARASRPSRYLS